MRLRGVKNNEVKNETMVKALKEGTIKSLDGGDTKHTFLLTYETKKYILRKFSSKKDANYYLSICKKLLKYNFLPKFYYQSGRKVLFEYIEGRDCNKKDASRAGTYQVNVQYSDSEIGSTPLKDVTQALDVGANTVRIEFLANESREYGYLSPKSAKGTAQIQLSYLASEKELLNKINSDHQIDKKILDQFLKDEGLNTREAQSKPTINKFIERKIVQFYLPPKNT